ncbi:prolyl-tRNA synthetase associated domain-containing protein [Thermodesulfobacteriota bacterium]
MTEFFEFLGKNDIAYERHDHPPLYTVEDVMRLVPHLPGTKTKNLFLRDKPGKRHFLIVIKAEKKVDLKRLQAVLESSKLSFGSPKRLKKYLDLEPGAVSIFAIFNDVDQQVELYIDEELWSAESFQFHPLVNTSTLTITKEHLERFLAAAGHDFKIVKVPDARPVNR